MNLVCLFRFAEDIPMPGPSKSRVNGDADEDCEVTPLEESSNTVVNGNASFVKEENEIHIGDLTPDITLSDVDDS